MSPRRHFFGAAEKARERQAATVTALVDDVREQLTPPEAPSPVAVARALNAVERLQELLADRPWLDLSELCRYLEISRTTYYRMVRAKTWAIPEMWPRLVKGPRFHVDDLARFVRSQAACHASERLSIASRGGR